MDRALSDAVIGALPILLRPTEVATFALFDADRGPNVSRVTEASPGTSAASLTYSVAGFNLDGSPNQSLPPVSGLAAEALFYSKIDATDFSVAMRVKVERHALGFAIEPPGPPEQSKQCLFSARLPFKSMFRIIVDSTISASSPALDVLRVELTGENFTTGPDPPPIVVEHGRWYTLFASYNSQVGRLGWRVLELNEQRLVKDIQVPILVRTVVRNAHICMLNCLLQHSPPITFFLSLS